MNSLPRAVDIRVPSRLALFLGFLEIALSGFGGVLPWARRVIVDKRGWLTADEFTDLLSLCQLLPGPNVVNLSVMLGARFHLASGAIIGFVGLLAAPMVIVVALGALYTTYGDEPRVRGLIAGMASAASGLLVATGLKMLGSNRLRKWFGLTGVAAFVSVALLRMPLAPVLLCLAPVSIVLAWYWQAGPDAVR